jgi:hypothetical protein
VIFREDHDVVDLAAGRNCDRETALVVGAH